ncbi:MAG: DUF4301 family protein [Crocinitomicaceae bacterium]
MPQINEELKANLPLEAQIQLQNITKGNPPLELVAPCRIEDGILKISDFEKNRLIQRALSSKRSIAYFIPASGSGSRMFQFLFGYLTAPNEENTAMVEHFFNSMEKMAFYTIMPLELRDKLKRGDFEIKEIAQFILGKNGLELGILPKGLIPFHKIDKFVLNPFQDQILQGENLHDSVSKFHFTIQKEFETHVKESVDNLRKFTGPGKEIQFSEQKPETDAFAFDNSGKVVLSDTGSYLRRPAGHGALLENLVEVEEEVILIKNIDNIQHMEHQKNAEQIWQMLIGLLDEVKIKIDRLVVNFSRTDFQHLNDSYQLFNASEIENWSDETILEALNRPIRVCGMVRNLGQAGGGPYWVKNNGSISKQIVEKAQIAQTDAQQSLMIKSTHFNPVMMALSTVDAVGKKFNLKDFVDKDKYFIVEKEHKGKKIKYCELPGLWNGSMSNWNTLFVEIPNQVFSPVKTMLDLLLPAHLAKKEDE